MPGARGLSMATGILVVGATLGHAQKTVQSTAAIESLQVKVWADSNEATVHYALAMAYWNAHRYDDADRELHEAVTLAPQYAEAFLALSALPLVRGEKYWRKVEKERGGEAVLKAFQASGRSYRRAFLLNPLVDLQILGKVDEGSGSYGGRAWWLWPLDQSVKSFLNARYDRAFKLLQGLLDDRKAGRDGENLPHSVLWYHGLAAAHLKQYDVAIHDLAVLTGRAVAEEQADSLNSIPLHTNDFRYALATVLYLAGRNDQAAATFRRALEFDAGLYPAHVQLARILEHAGRWEEALEERRAAVTANPDDSVLLTDLAQTLLRLGRMDEAGETLDLATAANPRDAYPAYLAGVVSLRLNRRDAARDAFHRFLALAPSRYAEQIAEVRSQLSLLEAAR